MSRPRGGFIGYNPAPAATAVNSAAGGIWTLREAEALKRAGTWPSASYDPFRDNVLLLLHFDGANNSTTFTDTSPTPKTFTAAGNAKISTAQSKFGGASLLLDGTGDWLSATNNFAMSASQSFTVECWVYWPTKPTGYAMILSESNAGGSKYITVNGSSVEVQFGGSAATTVSAAYTFSNATWHHLAVVRDGTSVAIYVDGVSQTVANATQSNAMFDVGATMYIGRFGDDANKLEFNGYIDDLRITRGVARSITLPTAAYLE